MNRAVLTISANSLPKLEDKFRDVVREGEGPRPTELSDRDLLPSRVGGSPAAAMMTRRQKSHGKGGKRGRG